ncbi:SUMF1/EgtB/PvdO family nonheme iron enzyme [Sedimenticola hydrogenitrophicus]|uniref:SUMF1/EgtB/PvdO family nonheme iron enzyme n=1 Tax=Sedimenticola hydrogenitrophicus TaxID=2967975 RepID=UPI0021A55CBC|nr:SUMF1/EgtB/PvdO family nonheme iron enzyme [Sedimenticola hydrogenitrophicus]
MQCAHCHHQIDDPEALFCARCGHSLRREELCRCCGKHLQEQANFCDRCGAPAGTLPSHGARRHAPTTLPDLPEVAPLKGVIEAEVRHHLEEAQVNRSIARAISEEKAQQARLLQYGLRENDWIGLSGGTFLMGSPEEEKDRFENERQHTVSVKRFEILKTPVTFAMFDIFCDGTRRSRPRDETWGRGDRPVINVSYWSAMDYCRWLSKRTGTPIRLPTEAEWEYACRADTTTPFWSGDCLSPEQANFDGNYTYGGSGKGPSRGQTTPVSRFPANPWGLHDMHGNIWEWCASVYDEHYSGLEQLDAGYDADDPRERVVRGGSWHNVPGGLRSASRNKLRPNYHYLRIGFRIVRDVEHAGG